VSSASTLKHCCLFTAQCWCCSLRPCLGASLSVNLVVGVAVNLVVGVARCALVLALISLSADLGHISYSGGWPAGNCSAQHDLGDVFTVAEYGQYAGRAICVRLSHACLADIQLIGWGALKHQCWLLDAAGRMRWSVHTDRVVAAHASSGRVVHWAWPFHGLWPGARKRVWESPEWHARSPV
jgi:hypothetical protein